MKIQKPLLTRTNIIGAKQLIKGADIKTYKGREREREEIPIHELASAIGPVKSSGLLMFHALTGCDTTSFFNEIGKKTEWSTWKKYTDADLVFKDLSLVDNEIDQCKTEVLERFVVMCYDKDLTTNSVNEARKTIHLRGTRSFDKIPPTQGRELHIRQDVCGDRL